MLYSVEAEKKIFGILHESLKSYSIAQMIELHQMRFEWTHDEDLIYRNLRDFDQADNDFDPLCLKNKEWEFIKEDIELAVLR